MNRDLLDDAKALYDVDHLTAAAMTARVAVERELTRLAMSQKGFGEHWIGLAATADWLKLHCVMRKSTHGIVIRAAETGNAAAHGGEVSRYDVQQMFTAVEALRHTVRRKCGKVGAA